MKIILVGFLLPLTLYLITQFWLKEKHRKWLPYLALVVSLASTVAFFAATFLSNRWTGATQIVWRGIQSNEKTLTIGGSLREEALIGWSNQAFAPKLKATINSASATAAPSPSAQSGVTNAVAALEISDAGAFVFDENQETYLNGSTLQPGVPQTINGKQLIWRDGWGSDELEIIDGDNQTLAKIELANFSGKTKVDLLTDLLGAKAFETDDEARRLTMAEQWAQDLKLLRSKGEVRLLDKTLRAAECRLPCRLTLQWSSTQKMPVVLRAAAESGGVLQMLFLPPWRKTTPLPPANKDGKYALTVTGRPQPGEVVFTIPLGYAVADKKPALEFVEQNGAIVFAEQVNAAAPAQRDHFPDQRPATEEEQLKTGANLTSKTIVPLGNFSLLLATAQDLPSFWSVLWRFILSLACFALGLMLVARVLENQTKAAVFYGLAACLWNFLTFRLLLAFRFAAEPDYLDNLTVKGVTVGFVGLTLAPGFLFLWTRLRCDFLRGLDEKRKKAPFHLCLYYVLLLLAVVLTHWRSTPNLWANLPERFQPASAWMIFPLLVLLFLLGSMLAVYKNWYDHGFGYSKLREVFLFFLTLDKTIVRYGETFWDRMARDDWFRLLRFFALWIVLLIIVPFGSRALPANVAELVQETCVMFFFCTSIGFVWLTAHFYFAGKAKNHPGFLRIVSCLLLFLLAPLFVLPVLTGDTGAILATFSIFVMVTLFLLTRRFLVFGAAMLFFLLAFTSVLVYFSPPISLPGEANARLLAHHKKDLVAGYLLKAETEGEYQKLANAYRHSWETQAMAYQGGWGGMGFGDSPTRLSHVRQDTLQFDSLYSFFIVGEHGLLGGAFLLLMYFVPLALTLYGGSRGGDGGESFHFGYAAASVVFGAFLLEAVLHAGMNLGVFPITGRGMPLINVNSITDLFRWTFLFAFASQLLTWRDSFRTEDKKNNNSPSGASPSPENQTAVPTVEFLRPLRNIGGANAGSMNLLLSRLHWAAVLLLPLVFMAAVVFANVGILRNKAYGEPFSWSGILIRTENLIAGGLIGVNQEGRKLDYDFSKHDVPDKAFIRQEIMRFNALPEHLRLDNSSGGFAGQINSIANQNDFNNLMNAMRVEQVGGASSGSASNQIPARPALFRLLPPERWITATGAVETRGGFRAAVNPAFNTQTSFHVGVSPEDLPAVTFRDGTTKLLGPAWVSGKWVTVVDPNYSVPWLRHLARAMEAEWSRKDLGTQRAAELYGTLTLDGKLHVSAANFAADKGREIHRQMFIPPPSSPASPESKNASPVRQLPQGAEALPPRVALAVISLPQGETLALGGYPRMTTFENWRRFDTGEWLPPADWVERKAPRDIRTLYGGDKNFQPMVVGSATKPIWANAVLRLHKDLERKLAVRGNESVETDVFGIRLVNDEANGWETVARGTTWIGFTDYLAKSDNRYHVRLGFLGLAPSDANGNLQIAANGDQRLSSNSNKESMDGGRSVWGRYPLFQNINFSHENPRNIGRLDETPLARRLESIYSLNVDQRKFDSRYSFWTKNENDDLNAAIRPATSLFEAISPEIVNLRLGSVQTPRDYVALLMGGGTNRWSNLELAGAFGACLTGQPLAPHIVKNNEAIQFYAAREKFQPNPLLQAGLGKVLTDGTATEYLNEAKVGSLTATEYLSSLRADGYEIYAKTGTLNAETRGLYTSRFVLAIIKWENKAEGKAKSGLVFSFVAEKTAKGSATRMLGEFLIANREHIQRLLNER